VTASDEAPGELTARVLESLTACANPRLRAVLSSVVRHVHECAVENALTEADLMEGIRFLTEVGHHCTDRRQEFILLSDTLGLSMLVDLINHGTVSNATESTVLGPFYVPGAPWRADGDPITDDLGDEPLIVTGRVTGTKGQPLGGAIVDVWQNAPNRLYAVQDDAQDPDNLRGRFRTGTDGRFSFRTTRPVDYSIPDDGPVGRMLRATGRHPWRPAHIHLIVSADGFVPVTTHMFDAASAYLDSDVVFGVKRSLVHTFTRHDPTGEPSPEGIPGAWYTAEVDIVLQPAAAAAPTGA